MPKTETPVLAQYLNLDNYIPKYGDYVIWSGWFATWHGLVVDFDAEFQQVSIIFAGLPYLLFTLSDEEQEKETKKIPLTRIQNASRGAWAVMRHEEAKGLNVWYI